MQPSPTSSVVSPSLADVGPRNHTVVAPLRERGTAVEWLLGTPQSQFFRSLFGGSFVHVRRGALRLEFEVEECLRLLLSTNPAQSRAAQMRRGHAYVLSMQGGADASQLTSVYGQFWNCTLCRHDLARDFFETVEDEATVMKFIHEKQLRTCHDLRDRGEGWTFILNQVQGSNASLRQVHHALFACLGISGGFNAYLTPGKAVGKAPHADDHDVFIVQQAGSKSWTLLHLDQRTVLAQMTLCPGDVLYIPQGIPHYAVSVADEPSLHVAMSARRTPWTCAGVLAAMLERKKDGCVPMHAARRQIEWRRGLLASAAGPMHPLNQLLPFPTGMHLLMSLCEEDLPENTVRDAALILLSVARAFVDGAERNSMEPGCDPAAEAVEATDLEQRTHVGEVGGSTAALDIWRRTTTRLRRAFDVLRHHKNCGRQQEWSSCNFSDVKLMLEMPLGAFEQLAGETLSVMRAFHVQDHYVTHGPQKTHPSQDPAHELFLSPTLRLQRSLESVALLQDDLLFVNGHRLAGLNRACFPAFRFALAVHSGSMGQPFAMREVPVPPGPREEAVSVLLRYGGIFIVKR